MIKKKRLEMEEIEPVSYTHLDVYKRQDQYVGSSAVFAGNVLDF